MSWRDVFAGMRILTALFALAMTLTSAWPYMYLKRERDASLGGESTANEWMNRRSLSLHEFADTSPREPAWLLLPIAVIGIACWERLEARLRFTRRAPVSRTGATTRLLLFVVGVFVLLVATLNFDPTHRWSDGPAKQVIEICGWLGLVGVLVDMGAVNRESRQSS